MKLLNFATLFALVALVASVHSEEDKFTHYHGFKVFRAEPVTKSQVNALAKLQVAENDLDFWTQPSFVKPTDILTPPEKISFLESFFQQHDIPYDIMISDFEALMSEQRSFIQEGITEIDWDNYHTLASIENFMTNLSSSYPDKVSVIDIGKSYEGRSLHVLKLSNGGSGKPAFFIDSAVHSREWITVAVVTYIMNELITKPAEYGGLLDKFDFYFMPVFNVDGYVYTFETDRNWRKTRSDNDSPIGCMGVDPNRNYGFKWNTCEGCSSSDKCSQVYRGPTMFSETEVLFHRNFILTSSVNWQCYISFHSYGQMFVTPWGYTTDLPEDYNLLYDGAKYFSNNLTAVHGTEYIYGTSSNIVYPTDGTTQDWAKGAGGFKYAYTAELRDRGRYGFFLPPEQIKPSVEETMAGFLGLANYLVDLV